MSKEIENVDAQPLRYGHKQYMGAVRAYVLNDDQCISYLKRGEILRIRRGAPKSETRERQLKSMLRQTWFDFRHQAKMAFPAMSPMHMFIPGECISNKTSGLADTYAEAISTLS
jgi:hypothetical protein